MRVSVRMSSRPISVQSVLKQVATEKAGGSAVFVGTVRDSSKGTKRVSSMDVEAAKDLAERDIRKIAGEAIEKFGALKIAVAHRTGRLSVGDTIVVIASSAAHRKEAFRSCEYVIDQLKKTTPIWKKEHAGKKARWVTAEE